MVFERRLAEDRRVRPGRATRRSTRRSFDGSASCSAPARSSRARRSPRASSTPRRSSTRSPAAASPRSATPRRRSKSAPRAGCSPGFATTTGKTNSTAHTPRTGSPASSGRRRWAGSRSPVRSREPSAPCSCLRGRRSTSTGKVSSAGGSGSKSRPARWRSGGLPVPRRRLRRDRDPARGRHQRPADQGAPAGRHRGAGQPRRDPRRARRTSTNSSATTATNSNRCSEETLLMEVIVPFSTERPKSRLSAVLTPDERAAFARTMLQDVLAAIDAADGEPRILATGAVGIDLPPGGNRRPPLTDAVNAAIDARLGNDGAAARRGRHGRPRARDAERPAGAVRGRTRGRGRDRPAAAAERTRSSPATRRSGSTTTVLPTSITGVSPTRSARACGSSTPTGSRPTWTSRPTSRSC